MPAQPMWPRSLFFLTVVAGLLSTALSLTYLTYKARIQQQQQELALRRAAYEARIAELQKSLVVEKVISEQIQTPVTEMDCRDLGLFAQRICVPIVRMELRPIQRTIQVEDPAVKAQLDESYAQLTALSQAAEGTGRKIDDLQPWVDLVRKLMAPAVSVAVLIAGVYVILSRKYVAESEKWAYGALGTILGYWLK